MIILEVLVGLGRLDVVMYRRDINVYMKFI